MAASEAEKVPAFRVLLLACTVAPAESAPTVLSLVLPLLVGCMCIAAEGAPTTHEKELSTMAQVGL